MKGQAGIGTMVGWGITILLSLVGSMATANRTADSQINKVRDEALLANIESVQRISTLEEAVSTIKDDTAGIKNDIKQILQILR